VSLSLKKALTERNITKGFSAIGIWLVNVLSVDSMLGPSQLFCSSLEETDMGAVSLGASNQEGQTNRGEVAGALPHHDTDYNDEEEEAHLRIGEGAMPMSRITLTRSSRRTTKSKVGQLAMRTRRMTKSKVGSDLSMTMMRRADLQAGR
jgi:hypothetical protein